MNYIKSILLGVMGVSLLTLLLIGERGAIAYFRLLRSNEQLRENIDQMKIKNLALVEEIELLKHNKEYQIKMVRKILGHIAQDESLIIFKNE